MVLSTCFHCISFLERFDGQVSTVSLWAEGERVSDDGVYKVQNDFEQVDSTIQILNAGSRGSWL